MNNIGWNDKNMNGKVYIIILNWNGWKDTIECLESVFSLHYFKYQVIVCDNDSTDGSMEYIKKWATGRINSDSNNIGMYTNVSVEKPIEYMEYNHTKGEKGGNIGENEAPLILINTGSNLGFAGGNNVGIRFALAKNDFDYIWLLNNDTVVKFDALSHLVNRMEEEDSAGLCGSTLLYYDDPLMVQAYGGFTYNKWLAHSSQIGHLSCYKELIDTEKVENDMFGIQGASVLVSRELLLNVGLMCEDYFLYFEEQDWAVRARKKAYKLLYASKSIVYHKEGKSIGSDSANPCNKSKLAEYYTFRNKLLFTREKIPYALPGVYISLLISIFIRIKRLQFGRIAIILKALNQHFSEFIKLRKDI